VWSCQGHGVCPNGGSQQILYGWAKGAAAMQLPEGVGYKVGGGTRIDNLVLQVTPFIWGFSLGEAKQRNLYTS